MVVGHKIDIKYVGIEKEDYVISCGLEDVEGCNLLLKEGQEALLKRIESISGMSVQSISWNEKPIVLREFIPLGFGANIIYALIEK